MTAAATERRASCQRAAESKESKVDIDFPIRPLKSSSFLRFGLLLLYMRRPDAPGQKEGHGAEEWVAAVALDVAGRSFEIRVRGSGQTS